MEWLSSGRRRDICILLYGEERRAQQLKSDLEQHYDRRLAPDQFYGALSALESGGHVEKRVAGLNDVYVLSPAGRRAVEEHYEWYRSQLGREGTE